ncbi:MAG: cyclic nucleotide-binding domain-containing protein [Gammaproteobacteria bacterium]|nr:cyclic nucleotide-binding domain-containing protein [Gammaproteobacteria bacterium]MBU1644959.1 cyclic nucleotide-binding domain-containing protein [Gammaproteobacteria bacterium]MBU1971418.1 cyclic nucleotide-binding domain-containing protein [Gammaproteobacteria bacterium]
MTTTRGVLAGDAWGGLAAMLVALPSAIAFGVTIFSALGASHAAAGALAGILGATALGLVAPAFGGSSRLITAPCAPAAAVLAALAITFTQQGVAPAAIVLLLGMIGLLAGLAQIGLGLAGVGRLIKFIPFPVVSGYLSGVGLIIIGSQVPKFVGAPSGTSLIDTLKAPSAWMWQSIVVGAVVAATMLLVPRLTRAVPAAILALLAGIGAYLLLGLADPALLRTEGNPLLVGSLGNADGNLAEAIEKHWLALRSLGLREVAQVLAPALTLAVLLSIDTLKTCLVIDAMTRSHHEPNRELIGQGLGNIASSLVGGIPGAGTMGASLINVSSGGTTRRSGLFAGAFSLLAFMALAPLIAWVPIAALAAILIVIGLRMIDRNSLMFFYSPTTRLDFIVILAVILVAIFGNLVAASGVGVALAILLFLREQSRSSVVRNRIDGHHLFLKRARSTQDIERLEREGGEVVVFELQGSLFFGTASQLQAALEPEIGARKYIVLSMRRVQSLDITATHMLEQVKDRLEETGASLVFCDIPKGLPSGLKMKRFLKDTGVVRPTSKALAFGQLDEALEWIEAQQLAQDRVEQSIAGSLGLRDMPIFAGCDDAAIAALEAAMEIRAVKAGKRVFKAGAGDGALFIIRHGTVRLTLPIHKKDNYHLATSGPGDILGGMGFIEAEGHAADALALTDVEAYMLTREQFEMLAVEYGDIALAIFGNVARSLATRLRVAVGEIQALRG